MPIPMSIYTVWMPSLPSRSRMTYQIHVVFCTAGTCGNANLIKSNTRKKDTMCKFKLGIGSPYGLSSNTCTHVCTTMWISSTSSWYIQAFRYIPCDGIAWTHVHQPRHISAILMEMPSNNAEHEYWAHSIIRDVPCKIMHIALPYHCYTGIALDLMWLNHNKIGSVWSRWHGFILITPA